MADVDQALKLQEAEKENEADGNASAFLAAAASAFACLLVNTVEFTMEFICLLTGFIFK